MGVSPLGSFVPADGGTAGGTGSGEMYDAAEGAALAARYAAAQVLSMGATAMGPASMAAAAGEHCATSSIEQRFLPPQSVLLDVH